MLDANQLPGVDSEGRLWYNHGVPKMEAEEGTMDELPRLPTARLAPSGQPGKIAAWLQFPRRLVLLALAWLLSRVVIAALMAAAAATRLVAPAQLDWSISLAQKRPVAEIVTARLPNTLLLVGTAMAVALVLALVLALLAAFVHWLEDRAGLLGSIPKGLGRLLAFVLAAPPGWLLGTLLLVYLAVQLGLFPVVSQYDPAWAKTLPGLVSHVRYMVLPTVALAAFPAVATAQAIAREVTLPRVGGGGRVALAGLFRGLGTLLGQVGGLLGMAMVVEHLFAWPGLGWLLWESLPRMDFPVEAGVLASYALLILFGRLAAELFHWLERLVRVEPLPPAPSPQRKRTRTVYVVLALALLLVPLGLAAAGLTVGAYAAERQDRNSTNDPPSAEHPWGTDYVGRDLQARVLRGGLVTLGIVVVAAAAVTVVGGLYGVLTGFLAGRKTLLAESLADLLLWPAEVALFIPAIPAAIVLVFVLGPTLWDFPLVGRWLYVVVPVAIVLLPRAVRAAQALWLSWPAQSVAGMAVAGIGALFLGVALAAFSPLAVNTGIGLGVAPPTPELGSLVFEGAVAIRSYPLQAVIPSVALGACALALYFAVDALSGYFQDKGLLARLNE
jgi:peptide/nickel transport system permease protein